MRRRRLPYIVSGAAMLVILLVVLYRSAAYRLEGSTLKDQDQAVEAVASLLGPSDKVYVHGTG